VAAEVLELLIRLPVDQRIDEWRSSIVEKLIELQQKVESFSLQSLVENERFTSALLRAAQIAIRNHQQEKLDALRNAVLNAALDGAPGDDQQQWFLGLVDDLSAMHLGVLQLFGDPSAQVPSFHLDDLLQDKNRPTIGKFVALKYPKPETQGEQDYYVQIVRDLWQYGLISNTSWSAGDPFKVGGQATSRPVLTELGKALLAFIAEPAALADKSRE